MSNTSKCYVKNGEFAARTFPDETLVVPVRQSAVDMESVYVLNNVAAFIWNRLDGKTSLDAISEAIATEYDVSNEDARADAERLVDLLLEDNLIQAG